MDSHLQIRRPALTLGVMACLILHLSSGCGERSPELKDPSRKSADTSCTPFGKLTAAGETLTLAGRLFSGKACTRYKNGGLHTSTSYAEGKKEGKWEMYYPNGTLMKEGRLKNGKEEGAYNEYFPDGTPKYAYRYRNGLKTGVWKSWYEDGTPYTERHFEDDKLHGKVLVWDEYGTLAKEYDYRRGKLVYSKMHFAE